MTVFATNNGFDIFLQCDEKMIFITQCLVDGRDHHLLNGALQYRASIAELAGVFQAADAPPDDGFLSAVVPVDSAEDFSALAAYDIL